MRIKRGFHKAVAFVVSWVFLRRSKIELLTLPSVPEA